MSGDKQQIHNLPDDLRQSVSECVLAKLAMDSAQVVALLNHRVPAVATGSPFSPQKLLALLAYCYAAGICGSHDIETACHDDPTIRTLCGDTPPDWSAIWRFRNANRPWIEECLARVYDAVCRDVLAGCQRATGGSPISEVPPSLNLIDLARRRLRHAAWIDSSLYE